jgi:WD40-like Beta Propeller Repeat
VWSRDGTKLALASAARVAVFDARGGRAVAVPVERVRALAFAPDGRLALLRGHALLVRTASRLETIFAAPGPLRGLAWSPDGKWLLTSLPRADQWVFVQAAAPHRVLGVSNIAHQFGGVPTLDGWVP